MISHTNIELEYFNNFPWANEFLSDVDSYQAQNKFSVVPDAEKKLLPVVIAQ